MSKVARNSGHSSYASRASRFKFGISGDSIACVVVEAASSICVTNRLASGRTYLIPPAVPPVPLHFAGV
jgi:hypothetical protein